MCVCVYIYICPVQIRLEKPIGVIEFRRSQTGIDPVESFTTWDQVLSQAASPTRIKLSSTSRCA